MAIDKKLIHFKSKDNFMSANGVNGNIDSPTSGSEKNGNAEYGQVKGTSIAFVKDSKEIWTHGNLYKSVNWSTLGEGDNTTDGYHAELQDKTVEITENGTVEVNADAGYYGLNRVSIKTNVPQSGGGESGGGNIEYLDMSNARNLLDSVGSLSIECKGISDDISLVAPTAGVQPMVEAVGIKITQIKIDWDSTVIQNTGGQIIKTTVLESVLNRVSQDELDNIPRITKEQFYAF